MVIFVSSVIECFACFQKALDEEKDRKAMENDSSSKHPMKFVHPDEESTLKSDITHYSAGDEAAASDMIKDLELLLSDAKEQV